MRVSRCSLSAYLCDRNGDDLPQGITGRNLMLAGRGRHVPSDRQDRARHSPAKRIRLHNRDRPPSDREATPRAFLRRAWKTHAPSAQTSSRAKSFLCLTPSPVARTALASLKYSVVCHEPHSGAHWFGSTWSAANEGRPLNAVLCRLRASTRVNPRELFCLPVVPDFEKFVCGIFLNSRYRKCAAWRCKPVRSDKWCEVCALRGFLPARTCLTSR